MYHTIASCRFCYTYVPTNQEIFCLKCGKSAHAQCMPITITNADFRTKLSFNFHYLCDECSIANLQTFRDNLQNRQNELINSKDRRLVTLSTHPVIENSSSAQENGQTRQYVLTINNSSQTATQIDIIDSTTDEVIDLTDEVLDSTIGDN